MDYCVKIKSFIQIEKRKWVLMVGLVALTHLFCQSLMLPYGNALLSLLPNENSKNLVLTSDSHSSVKTLIDDNHHNANLDNESLLVRRVKTTKTYNVKGSVEKIDSDLDGNGLDDDDDFVEDDTLENVDMEEGFSVENGTSEEQSLSLTHLRKTSSGVVLESKTSEVQGGNVTDKSATLPTLVVLSDKPLLIESAVGKKTESEASVADGSGLDISFSKSKDVSAFPNNGSSVQNKSVKKKMRCDMPPKTVMPVDEMERLLVHHRARSRAMRPRWSSERDQEILAAKLRIESAPILKSDRELHTPLFRNISMFKRSYELMERTLKIYVYKEGAKPIFHQPILKGLYASEGWFMKLMERNNRYVVKDPRKAHLFYMPFSSRMLEYTLYVRNSHNRTNLRQYLKDYSEKIAAKYRFWNRTAGADHFLVACHDWAPYETRHHMEHCIKALCNADVTTGFKIGRDVSLPETYVRSARNPLRDLGGKPPSQRHNLAFYAGSMHGYLRPILLKYWKDKEPDMKILSRMPPGVPSKMNYIDQMKSSKYCICPKGYEVNSPRIVEAFFYECVPVIISDNFVPPFFEVLNWDAFSVIVAEKDIPNLKSILVSIPEQKYLDMQLNVRKVQKHFLWHANPVKYDLFHMTLHSIWYNRVFQIKSR
ncbi:Exostosin family protein [Perilla frutescens var. frutescens]|nr:Exostosin family protein [Perilla frutescens var. frutescens]